MKLDEYVNSIKNKSIAVIGIGISNEPLIRLLITSGCSVTACDKRPLEKIGSIAFELLNLGVKLKLGDDYLDNLDYDIIFRTPSLMPFEDELVKAKNNGSIITSEMELFINLCPCKIFAVTGSDGKSTTTTIIAKLLMKSGYNVHLGGNIGNPLLCELPLIDENDIVVLELSSFQLHSINCHIEIAAITNISPNHLDKHKDYNDYINAKKNIFINQNNNDSLILNFDDDIVSKFSNDANINYFSLKSKVNGSYLIDNKIFRFDDFIINSKDIKLPGIHNVANFLTAFTATNNFVSNEICKQFAMEFNGLEHRLETVRILNGVRYINDSIGSSPSRTIAGIHSLSVKPIIIVGGYDKNIPFDELGLELVKNAKAVILTGSTANKIGRSIEKSGFVDHYYEDSFEGAVDKAHQIAVEGDVVLLSPACASFDRFDNFMQRGDYFKELVMRY